MIKPVRKSGIRPRPVVKRRPLTFLNSYGLTAAVIVVRNSLLFAVTTVIGLLAVAPAPAQVRLTPQGTILARPRITQPIDDSIVVRIAGSRPQILDQATDLGRMDGNMKLGPLVLVLRSSPEQEHAVQTLLDGQQDKSNPNYHRWLTPDEFGSAFGVEATDIQEITDWLTRHGFRVGNVGRGHRSIVFSGTAAQVEESFHTEMHSYSLDGQRHYSNRTDVSIPVSLGKIVVGVTSLNTFHPPRPPHTSSHSANLSLRSPHFSDPPFADHSTGQNYIAPGDFAVIYNTLPLLQGNTGSMGEIDGATQSIAIVGIAHVNSGDIQTFRQLFLPSYNASNTNVCYLDQSNQCGGPDPGPNVPNQGWETEAMLDVEWAGAVAPRATIEYVASPPAMGATSLTPNFHQAAEYIIDGNIASVMSMSAQACEGDLTFADNQAFSALWMQAAAQGITVFVPAGDSGSAGCDEFGSDVAVTSLGYAVNGFASTPYNVSVGGTQFDENGNDANYWSSASNSFATTYDLPYTSALRYIPENVWNESSFTSTTNSNIEAGGGGISSCYIKPSWQMGPGVPSQDPITPHDLSLHNNCSYDVGVQHRYLPDVSLTAAGHDGYVICNSDRVSIADGGVPVNWGCTSNSDGSLLIGVVGGTSASSPAFAGIQALIDQRYLRQGQANYVYYILAASQAVNPGSTSCYSNASPSPAPSCVFNDVTGSSGGLVGSNGVPCLIGSSDPDCSSATGVLQQFETTPGYDLATGLGSVNALSLFNNWGDVVIRSTSMQAPQANPPSGVVAVGQTITFTAALTVPDGAWAAPPTGQVTFFDNGTPLGPGTQLIFDAPPGIDSYTSSIGPTSFSTAGQHSITAQFAGDANYMASATSRATDVSVGSSLPVLSALSITPSSVTSGNSAAITATLNAPAPASGVQINLTPSNSAAFPTPPSITISSGQLSGSSAPVVAGSVSAVTTVNVSASYNNASQSATVIINPVSTTSVSLALNVTQTTLAAGQPVLLTAVLSGTSGATPTGAIFFSDNFNGTVTQLGTGTLTATSSSGQYIASLPASFSSTGQHQLLAIYDGDNHYGSTISPVLNVSVQQQQQGPAALASFTISPSTVVGGVASQGVVQLTAPAPSGGVTVMLMPGGSTHFIQVQSSVTIPAGSLGAIVPIMTSYTGGPTSATVTASFGNKMFGASLTIEPIGVTAIDFSQLSVISGNPLTLAVELNGPAPAGGAVVGLSAMPSDLIGLSSVTVPAGTTSVSTTVTPSAVGTQTSVGVTATLGSSSVTESMTIVPAPPVTYTISGQVTYNGSGLGGVIVTLSGPSSGSAITNSSGNYSFSGLQGGLTYIYIATASLSGYTISPPSQGFDGLNANQTANFTATAVTSTISGQVTYNGSGLGGVAVTLSGARSASATTDASGNYSFTGLPANVNYAVSPTFSGFTFSPPSQGFTGLNSNQTANFTASANSTTYTISGQVTFNGSALSGVTVTLSDGASGSATTDSSGNYSFSGLAGGLTYIVRASLSGYTLSPPSQGFDGLNANQTANFTASIVPSTVVALTPGIISTAAGNGKAGYSGDGGPAANAELYNPSGIAVDVAGNVYLADSLGQVVRKVSAATGYISTVAGTGYGAGQGFGGYSGDGGPATSAELYSPSGLAVDTAGNLYISDYQNSRIRVVNMQSNPITVAGVTIQPGNIGTVAGNGTQGYTGDNGPATNAQLFEPIGVAVDAAGNIYIADFENCVIRMVSAGIPSPFVSGATVNGFIYTVAGNGTPGSSGNSGPATTAELLGPTGVTVDSLGNLYIADTNNNSVRIVSAVTNSSRIAGYIYALVNTTLGILSGPQGLAVDLAGNLYIVDSGNNRVREISAATGTLTAIAGNGASGSTGDQGSATGAELSSPFAVSVNLATGNFYITDSANHRVRQVNVQQAALAFGMVNIGQVSSAQDVKVSNVGNQALNISLIAASGNFSIGGSDTSCSAGNPLAPGASCILGIESVPSQGGPTTGSVLITDNAPNSPQTISLAGTGGQGTPTLTWNPATTSITSGTSLSAGILDATATTNGQSLPGGFVYAATPSQGSAQTVGVGTILPAGTFTLAVLFTPTDTTDYTTASGSISFTVTNVPPLTFSPTTLAFGNGGLGSTSLAKKVTLTNGTGVAVTISSISIGGANPADFASPQTTCGATLALKASCTISITFTPAVSGARAATLIITDSASNSPQTVPLSGTGVQPVGLSPATLAFASQGLGSTSVQTSVTLTNNMSSPLAISNVSTTGTSAGQFTVSSNACGSSVAAHSSCKIGITFTPSAAGAQTASLTIADNANNSPQTVALSGTGVQQVTLSPTTVAFGNQGLGSTSAQKLVTLTNNMSSPLAISNVVTTGTSAGQFTVSSNACGSSVAAHSSCKIGVSFVPSSLAAKTASLVITDNASTSPQSVALTGTGILAVSVTPVSLPFPQQAVGSSSAAKVVTIKNLLPIAISMTGFAFGGADPADFVETATTCGSSLASGASCTVRISFAPITTGSHMATLNIGDNTVTSPQIVSLSGTGK